MNKNINIEIEQINETREDRMRDIYSMLQSINNNSISSFDEFLEYRSGIYVAKLSDIYKYYGIAESSIINIIGVVCVKRVYLKDLGLSKLPYYCQQDDYVYNIGLLQLQNNSNFSLNDDMKQTIIKTLIDTALSSRNDSHTIMEMDICQDEYISGVHSALFIKYTSNDRDILIRQPITHNKNYNPAPCMIKI